MNSPTHIEIPSLDTIAKQLESVYASMIGVREKGFNSGEQIEEFQKAVDGKASKEPYCLGFIQWGAKKVCGVYGVKNPLHPTEHCVTLWNNTPAKYKEKSAAAGRIGVMKSRTSSNGHVFYDKASGLLSWPTIEANTNTAGSREGDGVYASTRWSTGTATKKILGHINLALMIQDAIYRQYYPKSSATSKPVMRSPNQRNDWSARIDSELMSMVGPTLLSLPYERMKRFAPDWHLYNDRKRQEFFADLLFAIARKESNHKAKTMFQEPDSMGRDKVTGYPTISEGLFQLSYHDDARYGGLGFKWRDDADGFVSDMKLKTIKSSWMGQTDRTINDPLINAKAAMTIITHLLVRNPKDEFADCLGRYWSVMRRFKKGAYRQSFLDICLEMQSKGYKI